MMARMLLFMTFCVTVHHVHLVAALECKDDEFACLDGSSCISHYEFCNFDKNCRDGSDEMAPAMANSTLKGIPCRRYNNICLLPENQLSIKHLACYKSPECKENEFECSDGSGCVSRDNFCDSYQFCKDGTDEIRRTFQSESTGMFCRHDNLICELPEKQASKKDIFCTKSLECTDEEFECSDGSGCIGIWDYCDDVKHCADGSDEIYAASHLPVSQQNGIRCRSQELICILPERQASKKNFFCRYNPDCEMDEFRCRDGSKCLHKMIFCDGESYCSDFSDEVVNRLDPSFTGIRCRFDTYVCLLPHDQAMKKESLCQKKVECEDDEFACSDGAACIDKRYYCTGGSSCYDQSDGISIISKSIVGGIPCRRDEYVCLLPESQTSKKDKFCLKNPECDEDEFRCTDGSRCLPVDKFCDGYPHCSDGSDEMKLNSSTLAKGIRCRRDKNTCVLPKQQASKNESLCEKFVKCRRMQFACLDGSSCIPRKYFCDGVEHCRDGSDEISRKSKPVVPGVPCRRKSKVCVLPRNQAFKQKSFCRKRRV